MLPRSRKNKGKLLQNYIRDVIVEAFKLGEDDVISRTMGDQGVDIQLSPAAREKFPCSVEAKNTKSFPSIAALRQSKINTYKDTLTSCVWKPPGKGYDESIIYFNFKEFIEWLQSHQ